VLRKPHVVILGGGFGGLNAARAFRREEVDVTLVDRTNHHLFQPLLYQVATAALAPSDIAAPIRWILRHQQNVTVCLGEVVAVDVNARVISLNQDHRPIAYDYLIVATGSRQSYFRHPEWESTAPGLKTLEDAVHIRRRFLLAFEEAEQSEDPAVRAALMTFVVVGGGPTGVELCGVLPDIARKALYPDFRRIDTRQTRVILIEGGSRVLGAFPEQLSAHAHRDLEQLNVEVRLNSIVTDVTPDAVYIGEERIPARTVIWAAGNAASSVARSLGAPLDSAGRVIVNADLSIDGHPEVFVIGDLAHMVENGRELPGVAQVAMQGGRAAARNIIRTIRGQPRQPFHYVNKGDLATIGRNKAVADLGPLKVGGRFAWWLWLFIHITYLIGFRNRLSVLLQWAYAYFTYQRGVRLIIGTERKTRSPDTTSVDTANAH
jgi:NADH:ubiquinone reductase (H+-translocating)